MSIINSITESTPYSVSPFCNPRNLHLFPEPRKNTKENFAPVGEKAVKILDMFGADVREQFSKAKKAVVFTSLFALGSLIPGFNTEAKAEPPKDGIKIAQNLTKTSIHTPKEQILIEEFCGEDGLCSKEEARLVSAKGYIAMRHGLGVKDDVENQVGYFKSQGYPAIALPSDSDHLANLVEMHVLGLTYEKQLFTGRDLNRGKFAHISEKAFDYLAKKQHAKKEKGEIVSQLTRER